MKKQRNNKEEKIKTQSTVKPESKELSNIMLLIFTGILATIYFVFATFSDGFYQHDEVGNFMGAQTIWDNNMLEVLGANTKSGFRLFYAIPAFGGFFFSKIFNSIIAALTVYFSYKLLDKLGSKNKILIFFLLGLQPLWFMLSFRNYAELLVAFLLVLSALQFFNKKYIFSAIIISYIAFTRQEYHLISGLLFWVLIFKKEWIAALLTGLFTVVQNIVGWIETGDPLYLMNSMMEYSEEIKGVWPKQGFDHYFIMSNVIFGPIALTLFIAYVAVIIFKKKKPNWYLLTLALIIFLLNCLMNSNSLSFGPGNGGNLRYLITISPILGILGVLALDEIIGLTKKYQLLFFLIPLLLAISIFQTYEHNFIKLTEIENWFPLIFAVITTILLILPLKQKQYLVSIMLISIFMAFTTITTRRIQPEEKTVKKAAKWYANHIKLGENSKKASTQLFNENNRLVFSHSLFSFYLGKNSADFEKEPITRIGITNITADTIQVGDVVIWDSHYGYRPKLTPGSQQYDFFDKNPKFEKIQYYQSNDKRFLIAFFRKISM